MPQGIVLNDSNATSPCVEKFAYITNVYLIFFPVSSRIVSVLMICFKIYCMYEFTNLVFKSNVLAFNCSVGVTLSFNCLRPNWLFILQLPYHSVYMSTFRFVNVLYLIAKNEVTML